MGQNDQGSAGVTLAVLKNHLAIGLVGMVGFHLEDRGCLFGDV